MNPALHIRSVIVDDEPYARKGIRSYATAYPFLEIVAECESALQLQQFIKEQQVDLIFLDIEMPYLTGIEFLQSARNAPRVVFITAYEEYALRGYELDVLDYLLKPVSAERFLKCMEKVHDYFSARTGKSAGYFFVKSEGRLEKIVFQDILFLEARENYVRFQLKDRSLLCLSTLKSMLEQLPSVDFLQVHKSYVIRKDAVDAIDSGLLRIGKFEVPIGKTQREAVMASFRI